MPRLPEPEEGFTPLDEAARVAADGPVAKTRQPSSPKARDGRLPEARRNSQADCRGFQCITQLLVDVHSRLVLDAIRLHRDLSATRKPNQSRRRGRWVGYASRRTSDGFTLHGGHAVDSPD